MQNFGLPDKTLADIRHILAECPPVEKAILYGSRAKGNHSPGSDIDLTLTGDRLDMNTLLREWPRPDFKSHQNA